MRKTFDYLTQLGYAVVFEQDEGMGGGIEYRSPEVWLVIGWERDHRTFSLEFASTHRSWHGRVPWESIDHLLRGVERFEPEPPLFRSAPLEELAAFLRANLSEIERRLSAEHRETTVAFLKRLESDRGRRAVAYWDARAAGSEASSSRAT